MKNEVKRTFVPGTEWLYIKLYASITTCDALIIDVIYPLSLYLEKRGFISMWFFIRYSDPQFHVRYRLRLIKNEYMYIVIKMLNKRINSYLRDGLVYRIACDTYVREVERYGISDIENMEYCFFENSRLICLLLSRIRDRSEELRWMSALYLVDILLSNMQMNIFEKQKFVAQMDDVYKKEFGFSEHNSKQLNTLYRSKQKIVFSILNEIMQDSEFYEIAMFIKKTLEGMSLGRIVNKSSYMHMMFNRLFSNNNRAYECIIYNFINRYYKSAIAIAKKRCN